MLIKTAIIVAIVLIGGTLMVNPDVDAAPGDQGTPFESVWNAIDNLGQTLGTIPCEDGQVVKWFGASEEWECADDNGADDNGAAQLNIQKFEGDPVVASFSGLHTSSAECPAGTTITGGGYEFSQFSNLVKGVTYHNGPINDQKWQVRFNYDQDGSGVYRFNAIVFCASITP